MKCNKQCPIFDECTIARKSTETFEEYGARCTKANEDNYEEDEWSLKEESFEKKAW